MSPRISAFAGRGDTDEVKASAAMAKYRLTRRRTSRRTRCRRKITIAGIPRRGSTAPRMESGLRKWEEMIMRFVKLLCAAAFAAAVTAAPASAKDYKIGYSVFWGTNPFLVTMVNGAKKAAEEWKAKGINVDIVVTNGGDTDKAKQVSDLEDLYAQKVNGVLIFPGDSVMVTEPIKTVFNANNIPVVITDIGVRSGKYISLIITDNKKGGESAGEYMAKLLSKGDEVITLDHAPTNDNGQTRRKGFETKAAELGLKVLKEQPVQYLTLDSSRQAMEDLLVAEPDVKGAFAFNQLVLQGAYQALQQAGKAGQVKLVGFDLDPVSYQMVKDGKIDALVVQDPFKMGYNGLNTVITYLEGGKVEPFVGLGTKLLTKDNAAEFANDPQVTGK